ncbi:DUF6046 domain-containing protein [Mucilaginibacter gossypii]|uniref:DUF6046 domain-containing protein n=1 Tax=Mucilaginibacter gossypii TaxID=551996 RepID=UPI000DCAF1FE|nr:MULTISPECIES: DUF6046 domain-containing protein [Mucilaginibacter]QTE37471.1 DUF6046 domain-containing protein [Mucilaginibacter gossypii]RAV52297.1 hypothetical protein DIU36_24490 [Mucilaginibacter rubeus]
MAGINDLIDNPITNNPSLRQATIVLTQNATVIGSQLVRTFGMQNLKILHAPRNEYQISQVTTQDEELYRSQLGTPVMADLTFLAGEFKNEDGVIKTFDTLTLVTVLISVSQTKNIVKTSIQGRSGTVKEYNGMGDYVITINGVITGTNGHYPKEEVAALKNMLISNKSIAVVSWFLNLWDIHNITIDDFSINPEEGGYSYQPFTIDASSDSKLMVRLV